MISNKNEYLTRCVVDTEKRKFYLYSSDGNERTVECETVDEFMNVLGYARSQLNENQLFYSSPL